MNADDVDAPPPPIKGAFKDSQFNAPKGAGRIGVKFADRRVGHQCPWPEWKAGEPCSTVCGAASDPTSSTDWCPYHRGLVYQRR